MFEKSNIEFRGSAQPAEANRMLVVRHDDEASAKVGDDAELKHSPEPR